MYSVFIGELRCFEESPSPIIWEALVGDTDEILQLVIPLEILLSNSAFD